MSCLTIVVIQTTKRRKEVATTWCWIQKTGRTNECHKQIKRQHLTSGILRICMPEWDLLWYVCSKRRVLIYIYTTIVKACVLWTTCVCVRVCDSMLGVYVKQLLRMFYIFKLFVETLHNLFVCLIVSVCCIFVVSLYSIVYVYEEQRKMQLETDIWFCSHFS